MQQPDNNIKRAVFYARVSTYGQVNGTSIEGQRSEVYEWAAKNGYQIVAEYADEAKSGRSTCRANFRRMVSEAPALKIEAVLCWKHSRLFRNMEEAVIHRHLLGKKGIKLVSIKEQIDDGIVGRLVEHVIMSISEFYCGNFAEDSQRGLCELTRQGYLVGEPLYGYQSVYVKNSRGYLKRHPVIDEEKAEIVRTIYQWRGERCSIIEIADRLNDMQVPSPSGRKWTNGTIYYLLYEVQEKYLGNLIYNKRMRQGILNPANGIKPREKWIIVPGGMPAIITPEMAEAANAAKDLRRAFDRPDQKGWPQRKAKKIMRLRDDVDGTTYRNAWHFAQERDEIVVQMSRVRENKDIPFEEFLQRKGYEPTDKDYGCYFGYVKGRNFYATTRIRALDDTE